MDDLGFCQHGLPAEEGTDEELCESVQSLAELIAVDVEVEVRLRLRSRSRGGHVEVSWGHVEVTDTHN